MIDKKKYMAELIISAEKMLYHKYKDWKIMKTIDGYHNLYKVCRNGLVYNKKTSTWLKPQQYKNGYLYVVLSKDGERRRVYLHRLMAEYFVPNPMPGRYDVVYHIDGDKWNNQVNNISWRSKSLLMRKLQTDNLPILQQDINKARDVKLRRIKRRERKKARIMSIVDESILWNMGKAIDRSEGKQKERLIIERDEYREIAMASYIKKSHD